MKKFLVILLLIFAILIMPASAETLSGTLDGSGWNSSTYAGGNLGGAMSSVKGMMLGNIESYNNLQSIIHFYNVAIASFDAGAPVSVQHNAIFRLSNNTFVNHTGPIIGTGQVGYQRIYSNLGVEQTGGYVYAVFDTWNPGTLTGTQYLYIETDPAFLYNYSFSRGALAANFGGFAGIEAGTGVAAVYGTTFTVNRDLGFTADYTATKPSGLGIQGSVTKVKSSRIYIADASHVTITSEALPNTNQYNFTTKKEQIYICAQNAYITTMWTNSSLLFSAGGLTPTPTPTATVTPYPTGTPGPNTPPALPNGLARTWVWVRDSGTGGLINGVTINIRIVQNNTWHNQSGSPTGTSWIDHIPGALLDFDINYPGVYSSRYEINQQGATQAGEDNAKWFDYTLYPITTPGTSTGLVDYWVWVADQDSPGTGISSALVNLHYGATNQSSGLTNSFGALPFSVPNKTILTFTVSKTGWNTNTKIINSGPDAENVTTIYLTRAATATPTTAATGVIPTKTATPIYTGTGTPGTPVPTTTAPQYNGFWAPIANGLSQMGAHPNEMGILLAALFVFVGFCIGGWSGAAYSPGAPFNLTASIVGGAFGFILSVAFEFIPLVYVIAVIFIGVFLFLIIGR